MLDLSKRFCKCGCGQQSKYSLIHGHKMKDYRKILKPKSKMPYGKYEDYFISEIPYEYLVWVNLKNSSLKIEEKYLKRREKEYLKSLNTSSFNYSYDNFDEQEIMGMGLI